MRTNKHTHHSSSYTYPRGDWRISDGFVRFNISPTCREQTCEYVEHKAMPHVGILRSVSSLNSTEASFLVASSRMSRGCYAEDGPVEYELVLFTRDLIEAQWSSIVAMSIQQVSCGSNNTRRHARRQYSRCVGRVISSVYDPLCLCVCDRALRGKRLELSTLNLTYTVHCNRPACTYPRSKVNVTRLSNALQAWVCRSI